MTTAAPLPTWARPHFEPGGGDAHLFYKLHGDFSKTPAVSRTKYRTAGVPKGGETFQLDRDAGDAFRFGLDGPFAQRLRDDHPDVLAAAEAAPHALVIRATIPDPSNLDYLRDVVGLITAFLDAGAVAVLDPFRLDWWTPDEWRDRAFGPAAPAPAHHVTILLSEDADPERYWMHTRGMIKFGRPDLSMRGLTDDLLPGAEELFGRFIAGQASGAIVAEGKQIQLDGLPGTWRCHHAGSMEDPDFNNVHIEILEVDDDADAAAG
jgi:hypothetical protein